MLPSTGYFKALNCPFYDSGLCERPYCHFRHVKKDSQSKTDDAVCNGGILQQLVSEAVKKVLKQNDAPNSPQQLRNAEEEFVSGTETASKQKVTYNPTPISELNKINNTDAENEESNEQKRRHIPVPYTPRKPVSLPIKRPVETNGEKLFIFDPPPLKYTPGSSEGNQLDPYTPKGTVDSKEKYQPGVETKLSEYKPPENDNALKLNYVPSDKTGSKKKLLEYKPTKVHPKKDTPSVTYQPTPLSQVPCFSSDEDEPENKKIKLSTDLTTFDELGAEFDILGQILDEESNDVNKNSVNNSKQEKDNGKDKGNKNIEESQKQTKENIKTHKDKRSKEKSNDKTKHESQSKRSDRSSIHKSSSKEKDREKEKRKEKDLQSKRSRHTSSKSSDKDSKTSSKSSRHSSSSKSTKEKHKNEHKSSHKKSKDKDKGHKSKKKDKYTEKENGEKKNEPLSHNESDSDILEVSQMDDDDLCEEISESDEEAIAQECKRIFEEYVPTKVNRVEEAPAKSDSDKEEYIPTKKRISHTSEKNIKVIPREPIKPDYKKNASQNMAERLAKVREYHASKNSSSAENKEIPRNTSSSSSKIRIAHVPYASNLFNAKQSIPPKQTQVEPSTSTITQTVKKGVSRVAHMPSEKFIDRPGVLEPLASKIAANVRSTYLNMMIDECLKIYLTATDAYARAQQEELATSKKCKTIQIYKNSAVLTVSRLRKEILECNGLKKSGTDCTALQKITSTGSGPGYAGSWSIQSKNKRIADDHDQFHGEKFYNNISKWILNEEQLESNGFPRPHPSGDKGRAIIYTQKKQKPPVGFYRTCCRCKKEYLVDKKGLATVKEECIYHPNNKYRFRGEVKYQCCSQDGMSDGCCVAPCHVYEYVDYENLKGYVKTMPPVKEKSYYGVYSLDCEMCYTTHGLDLTRITVIDTSCKVIYETLIKPLHPIIDYNTRYSGITEEQMANVKTTLLEVQATLLSIFNNKTILVGHSLESDFKALKLIHETVVDTSVLFPHKMGPPYKRALRNLSSEHLKKIIQNSVEGHDSAEDATVCMELLHYKLKEDLKTR